MTRFNLPKRRDAHDEAVEELIAAIWADKELKIPLKGTDDTVTIRLITGATDD